MDRKAGDGHKRLLIAAARIGAGLFVLGIAGWLVLRIGKIESDLAADIVHAMLLDGAALTVLCFALSRRSARRMAKNRR